MELPAPTWLSSEFLAQSLQKEEGKENIVITNFTTLAAVAPGNNYGSCIFRVKVEYKTDENDTKIHSLSLIMKSAIVEEGVLKDMLEGLNVIEYTFYYKYIPEANKLTKTSFNAKHFSTPDSSVIILEDLKEKGYLMADKAKFLDFEHCRLFALAAASFHAVSFAVYKEHPEFIDILGKEKLFCDDSKHAESYKTLLRNAFKCLTKYTKRIEKYKRYCKTIEDTSPKVWDVLKEAYKPSDGINTINQGDCFTTNMMFKYDDNGKVSEIKLIDFQGLRHASPINDLVFFIWTSANHDVKGNRLKDLYKVYMDAFNQNLEDLNCPERLSYDDFMNNVRTLNPLALYIVATMVPIVCEPTPLDFEALLQEEDETKGILNPYDKYYNDKYCSEHLPKLLENLDSAGVFDYLDQL